MKFFVCLSSCVEGEGFWVGYSGRWILFVRRWGVAEFRVSERVNSGLIERLLRRMMMD
jgi:hypothetical protein